MQTEIGKVRAEFQGILDQIAAAEKVKSQAKEQYAVRLDQGNEAQMSDALRVVRESNGEIEQLRDQLLAFLPRAADLRNQQSELVHGARAEKLKTEAIVREAAASLQAADLHVTQASGLRSQLNRLDSFLRGERETSM